MKNSPVDIAIIGAGPYGLSLAAHLAAGSKCFRIFGSPMRFWSKHMPKGMCLKSEGFASNLSEPEGRFTLGAYCAEQGIAYADVGIPVRIETFIAYALEFQRRYVPCLEDAEITSLVQGPHGFELKLSTGETALAKRVVVATGIMNFASLPEAIAGLPEEFVTHSSQQNALEGFGGMHVAVIGAGASAVDCAALLQVSGAKVELVTRRATIDFHDAPAEPRPLVKRLTAPRSGLGTGWRSRMCTDLPMVFHTMPARFRLRVVRRHLGPAPGWFVRDAVVGKVRMHLGASLTSAKVVDDKVRLSYRNSNGEHSAVDVDHVIAGTGYKVELERLPFLDKSVRERIAKVEDAPVLDRHFQTSVPGLYFIGASAANSFGPMLRFAFGADFAAKRLSRHILRVN